MIATLKELDACPEAIKWAEAQPDQSLEALWDTCPRGDWLLWLAGHDPELPRALLVQAACGVARPVLAHLPLGEDRPRVAIETAEAWCRGEATLQEVARAATHAAYGAQAANYAANYAATHAARAANYAATHAAQAANYAATHAAHAARAATCAAYVVDAASDVASDAAYYAAHAAAYYAARTASYAASAAAHAESLLLSAHIVREIIPSTALSLGGER